MEALQTDEQITPIKRHTAAGRARHRPRSFEDRGGRSPLITWDLDLYPQPPLNTRSPTLNSEEPQKRIRRITRQQAQENENRHEGCRSRKDQQPRAPQQVTSHQFLEMPETKNCEFRLFTP